MELRVFLALEMKSWKIAIDRILNLRPTQKNPQNKTKKKTTHTKTPYWYLFNKVFNYEIKSDQMTSGKCKYFGFVLVIAPQSKTDKKNNIVGSLLFLKFYVQVRMIYFFNVHSI